MSRHVLDRPLDRVRRRAHRSSSLVRVAAIAVSLAVVVVSVAAFAPSRSAANAAPAGSAVAVIPGIDADAFVAGGTTRAARAGEGVAVLRRDRGDRPEQSERTERRERAERRERIERRRAAGLARVGDDWRTDLPGWTVVFEPRRGSALGLTVVDEQRIVVRLHPAARPARIARVIAHELGHAYDIAHLDTLARRTWKAQRGLGDDVAWWPPAGASDFGSGAGDFAECHATMLVGSVSRSTVAGPCTDADLAVLRELLAADR